MRRLVALTIGASFGALAALGTIASATPGESYRMGETATIPTLNYNGAPTTVTEITASDWECSFEQDSCTAWIQFEHRGTQDTDPSTISYHLSYADGTQIAAISEPDVGDLYDGRRVGGIVSFPFTDKSSVAGALVLRGEASGNVLGKWVLP
ncbi:hypothetical protein [Nocardia lasii]|uniref:DUF4352 domain-containing protein n=1 Tax=Nocardia lasii TaxID=1616107 RepID=A0ABW1JJX7_9NOCA